MGTVDLGVSVSLWEGFNLPLAEMQWGGRGVLVFDCGAHPEVVADRILNFATVVGRENVIAGVDCGFGTLAGRVQVDTKIVWLKLQSLAEGARLASTQLWAKAA
jgi:5-methyltetrahydropteroyltriglutamate--homocysteine methyltransferase